MIYEFNILREAQKVKVLVVYLLRNPKNVYAFKEKCNWIGRNNHTHIRIKNAD